ncbi:tetratricopeptide repeat protein [Dokdonella sp.]|uniref:tetratricopeptide repeat protein n=1 Tax=Dokdonella sp. TaxID=2291710 RepID=UPI001B23C26F|nr:tetratricopeptide repeat protein [Dokdonella sp.]MBO9663196.1 tetratricopeptide repeat protein [Dokdonella sp.]
MKIRVALVSTLLFTAGIAVGYAAQKLDPSLYSGKSKEEAARSLIEAARVQAGDGSWERIAIGRLHYLGGAKAEGQAVFDDVLSKKHEASDEYRIGRVYCEAGEWSKAKPLFDRYVRENPKDEKELAAIGAYYLLNGDRATAESLFDRSFKIAPEVWATVAAAGAYLGVKPQE